MIEQDRILLARLRRVNVGLGEIALALMATQNGGQLHADGLRDVGQALRTLGADMIARADEIDATPTIENSRVSRAQLTRHQWQLLVDTLAEYCDATDGTREDLHDHAAGILHTTRPPEWESSIEDGPAHELWRHTYTVIGALAHLADAAPHDTRQLHTLGHQVAELAHHMRTYEEPAHV